MHKRITFIRMSYWVCAIFELLAVVPMLSPALFGKVMGIPGFNPGSDYRYAMGIAAVFTLGWICLLIWADRKPIERRGVLLLTIIPVFVGNMLLGIYAASSGFIQATMMVPSLITQAIIVVLFGISYSFAGRVEKLTESQNERQGHREPELTVPLLSAPQPSGGNRSQGQTGA